MDRLSEEVTKRPKQLEIQTLIPRKFNTKKESKETELQAKTK